MLLFCGQIAAQEVCTDSVQVSSEKTDKEQEFDRMFMLNMLVTTLGSEYDVILDYVLPDSFIAKRCDECYIVNALTGEEKLLAKPEEESPLGY